MTDRSPVPEPIQQAQVAFGPERANGLFTELIKRVGPVLGRLLLEWLLSQQTQSPAPAAAMMSDTLLWRWAVQLLKDHRDELVALIQSRVGDLVDLLILQLD